MKEPDTQVDRAREAFELANYIWENYVEYVTWNGEMALHTLTSGRIYDRPQIFLMGIGAAYGSIVQMLKSHGISSRSLSIHQILPANAKLP